MSISETEEQIEVVPYNPAWPGIFLAEQSILSKVLTPWLAGAMEHVGSTAVPGLVAKPVIDIMAPVRSLDASRAAIEAAQSVGYLYYPYKPLEMHWFCKPSPTQRTHHLHIVPIDSERWRQCLAFRNALRADASLTQTYASLKLRLADQYRHDREAYTEAKAPFILKVLAQANQP